MENLESINSVKLPSMIVKHRRCGFLAYPAAVAAELGLCIRALWGSAGFHGSTGRDRCVVVVVAGTRLPRQPGQTDTQTYRHTQTPTVYDVTVKGGNRTDPAFGKVFVTGSWDENPLVWGLRTKEVAGDLLLIMLQWRTLEGTKRIFCQRSVTDGSCTQ